MHNLFMNSLLILGGVGIVLGVMAATVFPWLWNICRFYYGLFSLLSTAIFAFLAAGNLTIMALLRLGGEFIPGIAASAGWSVWAHLMHRAPKE